MIKRTRRRRQAPSPKSNNNFRPQKSLVGRVQKNKRGFAFIIPEEAGKEDLFVSPKEALSVMTGDTVEYRVVKGGRRSAAAIVSVKSRSQKSIYGQIEAAGKNRLLVRPQEDAFVVKNPREAEVGDWCLGEIVEYPTRQHLGTVAIHTVLGAENSPRWDVPIAASIFSLPTEFSKAALQDADHGKQKMKEEVAHNQDRRDLTRLPLVTIDGEDAKDFDDAIYVERLTGKAAFRLIVAIADVSFFVKPGTALDRDAVSRSTSVYFPGVCIPMLPESLSNDLCSLRPRQERLALVAEITYDGQGNVLEETFYDALICTAARLTYEQVQQFFSKKSTELKYLSEPLSAAFALYQKLLLQRKSRGVLEFELPESKIIADDQGNPIRVMRAERHDSHRLIEEFMIAANQSVAKRLRESKVPALYRVHQTPDPGTVDEINLLMRNLGIGLRIKDATPRSLAKVLTATSEAPNARTLHQSILRMQKQARYEPHPRGHFGLALDDYTHFTSPIRRYPDLVVHRALKSLFRRPKGSDKYSGELKDFETLGRETSEKERRAMEAERFVVRRKQCWYMERHLGETLEGTVSGIIAKGLFIEIDDLATEGFLPLEAMAGRYVYDERQLCLRKRPGHQIIKLGDRRTVQVVNVSVEAGEIQLAEPIQRREKRR